MTLKKAKIDDSQGLNIFNEKLSNELKDCLVTVKKAKKLNDFITSLQDINAKIEEISK